MRLINLSSFPAGNFFESATHDTFSFFILPAPSNRNLIMLNIEKAQPEFSVLYEKSQESLAAQRLGSFCALLKKQTLFQKRTK